MNQFKELLKRYEVPASLSEDQAWDQLQQKIASGHRPAEKEGRVVRFRWARVAAAAAILLIAGGAFMYLNQDQENVVFASQSGARNLQLPDGSGVVLNSGSTLEYSAGYADERWVKLDGEAYFSVKKGQSFTVETPQGSVTVLGTTFNVYSRQDKFEVRCNSGRVRVMNGDTETVITAGQGVQVREGVSRMLAFTPDEMASGYEEAEYVAEPLMAVFEEIERQFSVNIESTDISGRTFDGVVPMNGQVEEALDVVCAPMGLTWERGNNNWIMVRKAD